MENYKLVIEFMDWGPIENDEFKDMDNWSTPICAVKSWNYIKPVISEMKAMVCGLSDKSEIIHLIKNIDKADFKASCLPNLNSSCLSDSSIAFLKSSPRIVPILFSIKILLVYLLRGLL